MKEPVAAGPLAAALAGLADGAPGCFHVALETALARRAPDGAEAAIVNGFLLFDCGRFDLCVIRLGLPLYWQMRAMELFAGIRAASAASDGTLPDGNVWQLTGRLAGPVAGRLGTWPAASEPAAEPGSAPGPAPQGGTAADTDRLFRLAAETVEALDRVWIGENGPRLFEAYRAGALLPREGRAA